MIGGRIEVKASFTVDAEGVVIGLASVFGTPDLSGDIVHAGAFDGARGPIPMLSDHDQAQAIGVWEEVTETPKGLMVKGRILSSSVRRAREVKALIVAGGMTGLSIGYVARKSAPRRAGGRDLLKVDLLEVSIVAVPMHPDARITFSKNAKQEADMTKENDDDTKDVKAVDVGAEVKAALPDLVTAALAPLVARLDKVEAKGNRAPPVDPVKEVTAERKAFGTYLRLGTAAGETELKAMTLSSDPNGGYLAPPELSSEILRDLVEMSPIRAYADVRGTGAGSVIYPTRKPFGNATWDDELDEETETKTDNFMGSKEIVVKGMSTFADISNMLLQDAPSAEAELRAGITEDFSLKESVSFVKGDGQKQPEGFMVNKDIAVHHNGHATVLSADVLIKLLYSMPQTYRSAGAWAMNGTTLGILRTMKDGQNNYLWQPSYQAGQPETVLGRPVIEMLDMPDVTEDGQVGLCPIIYGDFKGYRILDRTSLSILVDPYSQATRKITRIHAGRRVGGRVIMPAKFKKLKMAV